MKKTNREEEGSMRVTYPSDISQEQFSLIE
jgi:hypothetical protein